METIPYTLGPTVEIAELTGMFIYRKAILNGKDFSLALWTENKSEFQTFHWLHKSCSELMLFLDFY